MSDFVLPCDVREREAGCECVISLRRVSVSWGSIPVSLTSLKDSTFLFLRALESVGWVQLKFDTLKYDDNFFETSAFYTDWDVE